jgi:hypothetical protein
MGGESVAVGKHFHKLNSLTRIIIIIKIKIGISIELKLKKLTLSNGFLQVKSIWYLDFWQVLLF